MGPNTRLEFKRADGVGEIDVELPRAEYAALRDSGVLSPDSQVFLKPRRIRRFDDVTTDGV